MAEMQMTPAAWQWRERPVRDGMPLGPWTPWFPGRKIPDGAGWEREERPLYPPAAPEVVRPPKRGIYVASKTRHADKWIAYRERGWPISSTWIDEAGAGESADLSDLWRRCIAEASTARVLVCYREPEDVLKGGWVEIGAALACGVPVLAVGLDEFTIAHDRRITHFSNIDSAMEGAARLTALATKEGEHHG